MNLWEQEAVWSLASEGRVKGQDREKSEVSQSDFMMMLDVFLEGIENSENVSNSSKLDLCSSPFQTIGKEAKKQQRQKTK